MAPDVGCEAGRSAVLGELGSDGSGDEERGGVMSPPEWLESDDSRVFNLRGSLDCDEECCEDVDEERLRENMSTTSREATS